MGYDVNEKLVITPGWLTARSTMGDLHLISLTGAHRGLRVKTEIALCLQVIDLADGTLTIENILEHIAADKRQMAADLLEELQLCGVLGIADGAFHVAPEQARYIRQLEYFEDRTGNQHQALSAQRLIASKRIAIIGVGGVGSRVLMDLAMVGIKHFILIDPDCVELSNLSRQIVYKAHDQGKLKVEAAGDWLRNFEPEIEVTTFARPVHTSEDLEKLPSVDAIVRTAGYVPSPMGREVNRYCIEHGYVYLSVGGSSWGPLVGGYFAKDEDGCFGCFERTFSLAKDSTFSALSNFRRQVRDTHSPVFGPVIGMTASAAMGDFVLDLAGIARAQARGSIVTIAGFQGPVRRILVPRDESCPDCRRAFG